MKPGILFCTILFLCATSAFSQSAIYQRIADQHQVSKPVSVDLFTEHESNQLEDLNEGLYTVYDMASIALGSIYHEKKPFIALSLSLGSTPMDLELVEVPFLSPEFKVVNSRGQRQDVPLGKFYRGVVKDHPGSIAAISFFEDDVIGVVSTPDHGNMVLGKKKTATEEEVYVFYAESALPEQNPFYCALEAHPEMDVDFEAPHASSQADACKKINIYIEVDNIMYRDFSSNMTAVTSYVTGVFNVSSMLYENENVDIGIKTIKVWDEDDPYRTNSASDLLNDFSDNIKNDIDGDIGHVLTTSNNNLGGLAWVDVLCDPYRSWNHSNRTAMSNISTNYRQLPSYSWTVMVVTHEMGHNLGSHHTHRCVWGPSGNEALDNCFTPEGGCSPGPAPVGGGTIMSYCHLTQYGVNFTRGFGQEPGDRIRAAIKSADCIGGAFQATLDIEGELTFYEGDTTRLVAHPQGAQYSHQWFKDGLILMDETSPELEVTSSGAYYCEVTTDCSEYTSEIDVVVEPFYVSLLCPPNPAVGDEAGFLTDTMFVDTIEQEITVEVPSDLRNSLPAQYASSDVEIEFCLGSYRPARVSEINVAYWGPPGSGISAEILTEHENTFFDPECFTISLGDFDPTGEWVFVVSHNQAFREDSPEGYLTAEIKQTWEIDPIPSDCNLYVCDGDTALLDAGFAGLDYEWSTGEKTQTIMVTMEGTYGVTVTNGPIQRMDDIDVILRPTHFQLDTTVCEIDGLPFGQKLLTESGTYRDTFESHFGCDSILDVNLNVISNPAGVSEIEVCYGHIIGKTKLTSDTTLLERIATGDICDSVHTTVYRVLPELTAFANVQTACDDIGAFVLAQVEGNRPGRYTYQWSNGDFGPNINGVKSGILTGIISDELGCVDTIELMINNFDSVALSTSIMDVNCFGDSTGSIELNVESGTANFKFNWSNGDTTQNVDQLPSGNYSVVVVDQNGCSESLDILVDENDIIKADEVITPSTNGLNGSITLNPSGGIPDYTYLWEDGSTEPSRNDLSPGVYTVVITDEAGCSQTFDLEVKMSSSIEDLKSVVSANLFPNPANDEMTLTMELRHGQEVGLEVLDLYGGTVQSNRQVKGQAIRERFNLEQLNAGTYYLKINVEEGSAILKFIIIR